MIILKKKRLFFCLHVFCFRVTISIQRREHTRFGAAPEKTLWVWSPEASFLCTKTPDIAIGSCGLDADGQSGRPPKELFAAPAEPIVEPRCY